MPSRRSELAALFKSLGLHAVLGASAMLLLRVSPERTRLFLTGAPARGWTLQPVEVLAPPASAPTTRQNPPPRSTPRSAPETIPVQGAASGGTLAAGDTLSPWLPFAQRLQEALSTRLEYPAALRRERREGLVQLHVSIEATGEMTGLLAQGSGDPRFDGIAMDALAKALASPALREDARAIAKKTGREVTLRVPVRFSLP